jgi:hypothetical protein
MNANKRHPAGITRKTSAVMALDNSTEARNKYKLLAMWLILAAVVATAVRIIPM